VLNLNTFCCLYRSVKLRNWKLSNLRDFELMYCSWISVIKVDEEQNYLCLRIIIAVHVVGLIPGLF